MRLKSLTIDQYKNLKDFSLSFDGNSFIDVFVGKNGIGKSNLFEALIEIFRHLCKYKESLQLGSTQRNPTKSLHRAVEYRRYRDVPDNATLIWPALI
jgi:AAA15 family ATPase/GTPase